MNSRHDRGVHCVPRADDTSAEKIDFAKLDLTIEKVEERIAPSETNVFDK